MSRVEIPDDARERILALLERGLNLQAYAAAQPYGPLTEWDGTEARILAGRLAGRLGGDRTGRAIHLHTWRANPGHLGAAFHGISALGSGRGPLAAWEAIQRCPDFPDAAPSVLALWLALRATTLAHFRDFESAAELIARALELAADDPWLHVVRAGHLQLEDRPAEALDEARHSLEVLPWYPSGVLAVAHALKGFDRPEEALALLTEAEEHVESSDIARYRALVLLELDRFEEVARALDRAESLAPLADREYRRWLVGLRSDLACQRGDFAEAAALARQADTPFHRVIATRLAAISPDARRVSLDVPLVRQHHETCAPATLTAIAHFWGKDVEHVEVADAICYAGTPSHRERRWAEEHGWVVREFTLTWDSAVALLDRGVPFTLGLVAPGNGHLVAVAGYDGWRGTFLLRDPSLVVKGEVLAAELLEQSRANGPRASALVPREHAALLDGLDLLDAPLYDHLYAVQRALDRNDRPGAAAAYESLATDHPDHRLTLEAALALDRYDGDQVKTLGHLETLLAQFPTDANIRLARLSALETLARREERLSLLRAYSAERDAPTVVLHKYAEELGRDARDAPEAMAILRRALRRDPLSARCLFTLAGFLWDQQDRAKALALYRFAACLEDKNEQLARSFFVAARHLRQTLAAVGYLRDRYERFGARSAWPAQSLFWALEELERTPEGFALLEAAEQRRPADPDLLLYAADARGRYSQLAEAERLLAAARPIAAASEWLRAAAALAAYAGDRAGALARWREVVADEPLAMDAHRAIAQLTAETEGREAALRHLRDACERFPFHEPLHELQLSWLRGHDEEAAERVVRHLLEVNPVNGWARRELALVLTDLRRCDEALGEAESALAVAPAEPTSHGVKGHVLARLGRIADAKDAYRAAIRLSVDYSHGAESLVALCVTPAERREALAFVQEELVRQVILSNALFAFRQAAGHVLGADEVLARLREAHAARPDLWQAWSALVEQLTDMGSLDEAHARVTEAIERFPLLPALWMDLAGVERLRGDAGARRAAIEKALAINPHWDSAVRALADTYEHEGAYDRSRDLLARAVAHAPFDAWNHGYLAYALWRLGEHEQALEHARRALELEPGYDWCWDMLRAWSRELGRPELAVEAARSLAERRAGDARSWLTLARTLHEPAQLDERLMALERAAALDPRDSQVHDMRAVLLAENGRFEEARQACRPAAFGEVPPPELQGREAWVEAESGDVEAAIRQMEPVARDNPEYFWGWARLADWYLSSGHLEAAIHAATRLTQIAPNNATAWGYAARARENAGDRAAAREHLRRAMALDPTYEYAGFRLFDLAIDEHDLAEAAEVLGHLRAHASGGGVTARAVVLAARHGEVAEALGELRELCLSTDEDFDPFEMALASLSRARAGAAAETALRKLVQDPGANRHAGRLWVEACVARRPVVLCAWRLERLRCDTSAFREAVWWFFELLRTRRQRTLLGVFVARNHAWLRSDTRIWGSVGRALLENHSDVQIARWLADWRERSGAEPWMLLPLAVALRSLRRDAEAAEVGRAALALPFDGSVPYHHRWLALDAALEGNAAEAARLLASPVPADDRYYGGFLEPLVRLLADVQGRRDDASEEAFRDARRALGEIRRRLPKFRRERELGLAYRRAVQIVGRRRGSLRSRLWASWEGLRP